MSPKYLRSHREENLITPKGEYEEDYTLKVPNVNERVCYINHVSNSSWMWMYDVLISKFGVCIPFTDIQFMILEWILVAFSQLYPNSWAMI